MGYVQNKKKRAVDVDQAFMAMETVSFLGGIWPNVYFVSCIGDN